MKVHSPYLILFVLSGFLIAGYAPPLSAASVKKLEEEVEQIRRSHEAQAKNLATALNQLQEVLAEFQRVHGQIDQSLHQSLEHTKLLDDNHRRLEALEEKVQMLVAQLEELKATGLLPVEQVKRFDEFQSYQKGLSELNASSYKDAVQTLKMFIKDHPKSPYVEGAQYWVGESLYAMSDYPAAIAEFQKVVNKFPNSTKVAPSLLRQGLSFFQLQSFDEAKAFLSKLSALYPKTEQAVLARAKITEINDLLEKRAKEEAVRKSTL